MPSYSYHCLDPDGTPRDGVLTAQTIDGARHQLSEKGWKILQLKAAGGEGSLQTVRTASPSPAPVPQPARPVAAPAPQVVSQPESSSAGLGTVAVKFSYQAMDAAGRPKDGVLLATSMEDARHQLEARGLKVLLLRSSDLQTGGTTAPSSKPENRGSAPNRRSSAAGPGVEASPRLSLRQLNLLFIQFSAMINAGLSYIRGLNALAEGDDLKTASVANLLSARVNAGMALSKAMGDLPQTFDNFIIRLVKVGETTGNMHRVLSLLTASLTREEKQRSRIAGAMAYPAFILLASGLMVAFLLYYMLPGYLTIFKQTGARTPFITQLLITMSHSPVPVVVIVLPLVFLGLLILTAPKVPLSRAILEFLKYHSPVLKVLFRKALLIRVCRNLSLMTNTGITLVDSLHILTHPSTGYAPMDEGLNLCRERVEGGSNLADAMLGEAVFPPFLIQAVTAGEQIGKVPTFLDKWADMMEEELEHTIDAYIQMLEPLMLLVMGVVVGFVVLAAFLPVFSILQTLS